METLEEETCPDKPDTPPTVKAGISYYQALTDPRVREDEEKRGDYPHFRTDGGAGMTRYCHALMK